MNKLYSFKLRICVLLMLLFITFGNVYSQNWGFENTTISSPPNNWTAVTGTWTVHTTPANVRTGSNSMTITDPATSGTTMGTTNPFVTTTTAGNYLITMGWGKSSSASNALFYLGYRTGTSNTLNPTSTASGQAANINDVTWSRVTSVSAATVAAGSYGISLRAFRSASTAGTILYFDDIIMYASPSNVPDFSSPDPSTNVLLNANTLTWNNGNDNGTPASGIGGVVILRASGSGLTPPTLNPQSMYDPGISGAAGSNTLVNGPDTWTVVANIIGSTTTTFTDASATGGPYTYAIYMRDLAYNYSTGVSSVPASPCTNPATAGTSFSSATSSVCPGTTVNLTLTGNSFGLGQTYQWQSSSTIGGPYVNIGSVQTGTNISVNPMVSTYYRCEVVCSSGTPVYSVPVQVLVQSGYSGVFTINASNPTSGTNYQTFADAISALSACGITGPVIYNVDSASGPYTTPFIIPAVFGTSATNTITFNGNGALLNFNSTTTGERAGIKLNGADYVTINKFNITASGTLTTEYGYGIQLLNNADHNIINNNTINLNLTSSSTTNYAGILVNSTATAITTVGASLCDSNVISNNKINGGHVGIGLVGSGTTSVINGNAVINNTIKDFYTYGIYLNGNDKTIIESNDISRPTRSATAVFNGIYLTGVSTNVQISKNSIREPYTSNLVATTATFGIYLTSVAATLGNENIISNNIIYDFIGGTGNKNGILLNASSNVKVYHNTINLNDINATCTACANRGIYVQATTPTGLDFRNNSIYISSAGTASKQCVFFEPTSVANYTLENNNYYITSTTGTQNEIARIGGSSTVATQGTGYLTIADWKLGSTKETSSTSVDPLYVNLAIGNLEPTNGSLNNTGVGVGVLTDIKNRTRSSLTPDVGAYEFGIFAAGLDMSAENIVSPANVNSGCYTASEAVVIRVRNNSLQKINFAINPVLLTVILSGTATQTLTKTINTDTLASNGFMDVTMPGTFNLSVSGLYTITAYTDIAGDANIHNDTVSINRTKSTVVAGTSTASPDVYCVTPGAPVLTGVGFSGYSNLQWQSSITSGTGFVDIPNATGLTFTLPSAITQTTYFRLSATCGTTTVFSVEDTVTLSNPQVLTTTPASSCGSAALTLTATGSVGTTLNWYELATGGASVGTGNSFTTPTLTSTTNYYVSAGLGSSIGNVGPISPISVGTNSGTAAAITTYYMEFQVLASTTINTVDVFPTATVGSNGTIVIQTPTGTVIGSAPYQTTVSGGAKQTIPINVSLTPGTYRMGQLAPAISLSRNSDGASYPYTSSAINILSNNFGAAYYYYFYNWTFGTGCESPRTLVTATIQSSPTATIAYAGSPYCNHTGTVTPTQTGSTGGKYTSTVGLVIDSTTGTINLATSTLGNYTISYVIAASGNCPAFTTTSTIAIVNPATATLSYNGSPYCSTAGTASPTLVGNTGGIFSSTTGLIINSSTGAISLANSVPGTYTVDYTLPASGSCPTFNTSTSVTINAGESASISYFGSPYCNNAGIINATRTGSTNGVYSSTVGLDLNSTTGAINLGNSVPGSYVVSYTIAATANCPAFISNATVQITALPTASVSYASAVLCKGSGSASPTVTGNTNGTFSSSNGLSINSSTGIINLSSSSIGIYTINYTIPAIGGCPPIVINTVVTLQNAPNATISYGSTSFCINSGLKTVVKTGSAGGKFTSGTGLIIDTLTGEINTNLSLPGIYTIEYRINATGGCPLFTTTTNVALLALPDATFTSTVSNQNPLQYDFISLPVIGSTHLWNFDDPTSLANTSQLQNPVHVFTAVGTYKVSHKLTNTADGCSETTVDTLVVTSTSINNVSKLLLNFNAYPNPFSLNTTISFDLKEDAKVCLDVFDLLGRKINTILPSTILGKGNHRYIFNQNEIVSNGIYLLKLSVDESTSVIRLMQLK